MSRREWCLRTLLVYTRGSEMIRMRTPIHDPGYYTAFQNQLASHRLDAF